MNKIPNIKILLQPNPKHIFTGIINEDDRFDFSMCNPPFFGSELEREERKSTSMFKLKETEDFTEGGEIGFLIRMV